MDTPEALEHWLDRRGMKEARRRFVAVFNNRGEGADVACVELRSGSVELGQWMDPLRRLVFVYMTVDLRRQGQPLHKTRFHFKAGTQVAGKRKKRSKACRGRG